MDTKITGLRVRSVMAPIKRPPMTASGAITDAALVLIDLETSAGVTGSSYLFAYSQAMLPATAACTAALLDAVVGQALDPVSLDATLRKKFALLDSRGILGQSLSGIDMAAWDAHAKILNLPLVRVLGGKPEPLRAYNSCGLWIESPEKLIAQLDDLLSDGGFGAVKIRLGRPRFADDLDAVRTIRKRLPNNIDLMCDFNQSLSLEEALRRCRALDDEGLYWIEEPVRHDNYVGSARIAEAIHTPVQIGEYLCNAFELQRAIAVDAADYYMPDVQRIGGVTGWLRAMAVAHSHDAPISSHLFPEFSSHILSVSPTRHWLEYVDWANPVLKFPVEVVDGHAIISDRPGSGIVWDEDAIRNYVV
ncbi:MAG: mandelate racemase [Gammaproteobacteria bacterium]|jgi:mandelate racemase